MLEKCQEYNQELYLVMIDYEKAFDKINHRAMLQVLKKQGISGHAVSILEKIYQDATANVKGDPPGQKFKVERGVRQGDPISPKLFTALLEDVFRKCDFEENSGISIDGKFLTNLRFADDIGLVDQDPERIQRTLTELENKGRQVGLTINTSKTKVLTNDLEHDLFINGEKIEYVQEFQYLGQIISFENRQDKEIERRITNSWKAFWKLKAYLTSKEIQMKTKKRLFEMCILPVMTYGAQTWSLTKQQQNKLRVMQRAMERRMLKVTRRDRIRNEEIRRRTKLKDVITVATALKWKWAGHVIRRSDDRWSTRITTWYPREGSRRRGRQKKRWRDEFPTNWTQLAQDRKLWIQTTEEALSRVDGRG